MQYKQMAVAAFSEDEIGCFKPGNGTVDGKVFIICDPGFEKICCVFIRKIIIRYYRRKPDHHFLCIRYEYDLPLQTLCSPVV